MLGNKDFNKKSKKTFPENAYTPPSKGFGLNAYPPRSQSEENPQIFISDNQISVGKPKKSLKLQSKKLEFTPTSYYTDSFARVEVTNSYSI